jgi:hypothetical protein
MTEFWRQVSSAVIVFVGSMLLLVFPVSADSQMGCVTVEDFSQGMKDDKEVYSRGEVAQLTPRFRALFEKGLLEHYRIPGLFEVTRVIGAVNESFYQDRELVLLSVKAQGHSQPLEIAVGAVGDAVNATKELLRGPRIR